MSPTQLWRLACAALLIMLCQPWVAQRARAQDSGAGQPALPGAPSGHEARQPAAASPAVDRTGSAASRPAEPGHGAPSSRTTGRISRPTPLEAARAPVKPEPRTAPKPGPGAKDAGNGARLLRTSTLSLVSLIDRTVISRQKREIGHVIDVLVDMKGEPNALVVEVGGFMGVGNRRIAVAWGRCTLVARQGGDALQIPFSDAQIRAAPAFTDTGRVTVVEGAAEPAGSGSAERGSSSSAGGNRVDLGLEPAGPGSAPAAARDQLNPD